MITGISSIPIRYKGNSAPLHVDLKLRRRKPHLLVNRITNTTINLIRLLCKGFHPNLKNMKYIILVAMLFCLCRCRTYQPAFVQHQKTDTLIRLYTFGMPYFPTYPEESSLCTTWGFYREEMGCVVTAQELDSLEACNKIAEKPLVARYGKKWKEKFNRELRAVTASPESAIRLLTVTEQVVVKRLNLENQGDSIFYHFNPTKQHGVYSVDVVGYENKKWVSFFNYKVNCIEGKVTSKRKTIKTDTSYLTGNLYFNEARYALIPR